MITTEIIYLILTANKNFQTPKKVAIVHSSYPSLIQIEKVLQALNNTNIKIDRLEFQS